MGVNTSQNIISIVFGVATVITALIALRFKRLEYQKTVQNILDSGRRAGLFLSREAMISYLLEMYDRAENGDLIWAQCIRCTDFTAEVRKKILDAAGRGVRFRMLINEHSPAAGDFRALFDPIESAEILDASDNAISMQGLSDQEVVIAFPGVESYTAVLIRDPYFTRIMKTWFNGRFEISRRKSKQSAKL